MLLVQSITDDFCFPTFSSLVVKLTNSAIGASTQQGHECKLSPEEFADFHESLKKYYRPPTKHIMSMKMRVLFFTFTYFCNNFRRGMSVAWSFGDGRPSPRCTLTKFHGYMYTKAYIHGYPRKNLWIWIYGYGWEISYPRQAWKYPTVFWILTYFLKFFPTHTVYKKSAIQ